MTDGFAGLRYPPRQLFEAQQRRRRREQYRLTGYPRDRRIDAGQQAAGFEAEEPNAATTVHGGVIPPVRFRLAALSGEEEGALVELRQGRLRLGRDQDCEIRLTDMSVSHFHAVLTVGGQSVTIEDLGSTNRTYVNDEIVEYQRELGDGDVIRLGAVTFVLQRDS